MFMKRAVRWAAVPITITLFYNVVEGFVSLVAGVNADSLTLVAFGFDSYIEVLAAAAVLWRLSYRDEEEGERAEARALELIGATFILLTLGVVFEATVSLWNRHAAEESIVGIVLLACSVTIMPMLGLLKLRLAARLQCRS